MFRLFKNMKIKRSLILGFCIAMAVSVIILFISANIIMSTKGRYDALLDQDVVVNEGIQTCRVKALIPGRNIRDCLIWPDDTKNEARLVEAEQYLEELETELVQLEQNFPSQLQDKTLLYAYQDVARSWSDNMKSMISMYRTYRSTGEQESLSRAIALLGEMDATMQASMASRAADLDDYLEQGMVADRRGVDQALSLSARGLMLAVVGAIVVVMLMARMLVRSIAEPTGQVHQALMGFSEGRLDIPVDFYGTSELGDICDALRQSQDILGTVLEDTSYLLREMAQGNFDVSTHAREKYVGVLSDLLDSVSKIKHQLSDTLRQIVSSADQVAVDAERVAEGSQGLAQGTAQQASAVQQLSATVAEIAESARTNSLNSNEALNRSLKAGAQVEECVQHMEEMVAAMGRISSSSEEIGKIIGTIENIAFQTNILALNAAVEAARAGTAGKGFAVVADEVRNLATKSDQAAKATKELIDRSIESVQEGGDIVHKVSESLNKTMEYADLSMESMKLVARAVEQEAESIAQVREGIAQISDVVQSNSETSEQSALVSKALSEQAARIKSLLDRLRLAAVVQS